jgi:ribosomal protein L7/L12
MREDPKISQAMHEALLRGDKLQAIKLLREASGLGLKEAKERVEQLTKTAAASASRHDSDFDEPAHSSIEAPRTLPAAAMSALQQGHKIEAIKLTREHYNLGLKEAKDLVDAQQVTVVGDREIPPYQVTSGGGLWRVLLFIGLAIAGYFWFFGES